MNRIYRKVWNKALGRVIVASELASSDSVGVMGMEGASRRRTHGLALAIAATIGLFSLQGSTSVHVRGPMPEFGASASEFRGACSQFKAALSRFRTAKSVVQRPDAGVWCERGQVVITEPMEPDHPHG